MQIKHIINSIIENYPLERISFDYLYKFYLQKGWDYEDFLSKYPKCLTKNDSILLCRYFDLFRLHSKQKTLLEVVKSE